ncbi:Polypeptide N-acetylgalactosaminyltransferase 11 [Myotis brandtii]|uniref:Polypeptide N-acetylgalactosaminyltransferase 11 n=1 Tax=Myotis brandtii TaxID=109478 RepID=S7Q9G0_MYOBR|nr:Polypeptide N-acetylgalactosaminyltransferase 11 [Myotis brandtii]
MMGAAHAAGDVLVFLDSQREVNVTWLQPLLAAIREDRQTVLCPVIDIIRADTLAYSSSPVVPGGFNWGLHLKWDLVPLSKLGGPVKSPTMARGLSAMNRSYSVNSGSMTAAWISGEEKTWKYHFGFGCEEHREEDYVCRQRREEKIEDV